MAHSKEDIAKFVEAVTQGALEHRAPIWVHVATGVPRCAHSRPCGVLPLGPRRRWATLSPTDPRTRGRGAFRAGSGRIHREDPGRTPMLREERASASAPQEPTDGVGELCAAAARSRRLPYFTSTVGRFQSGFADVARQKPNCARPRSTETADRGCHALVPRYLPLPSADFGRRTRATLRTPQSRRGAWMPRS
jgi:hypothetical protein